MLNRIARATMTRLMTPPARFLLRLGISPDLVTILGTLGVCLGALAFYPRGEFLVGTLVITAFVFGDNLDGTMARLQGRQGSWGAFLDSTLDRLGDAAIFGGLLMYYAPREDGELNAWLALLCLVTSILTSYARSRAESLNMTAQVGLIERAERLVIVLVVTGLVGLFGWPDEVMTGMLAALGIGGVVTVIQRMGSVHRQVRDQALSELPTGRR